jgi:hypothetical protein
MAKTDYNAAWRNKHANLDHPAFDQSEAAKDVGRNYNTILDDPAIGEEAETGLQQEFPRDDVKCKSSDVAAHYLAKLVPGSVNVTAIAKAIVGDGLGPALINVYADNDPLHSNNEMKASLKIYQDWICPYAKLSDDKLKLKVGQPERNDAGQTIGIIVTGKVDILPLG